MKIKARGESRRITMSFMPNTYEALRRESKKHDCSIAEITRQIIDRSIVYGLLTDDVKNLPDQALGSYAEMQEFTLLANKRHREGAKLNELLTELVALNELRVDQLEKEVESLKATILQQGVALAIFETAD